MNIRNSPTIFFSLVQISLIRRFFIFKLML